MPGFYLFFHRHLILVPCFGVGADYFRLDIGVGENVSLSFVVHDLS
jgi:hypothetical protein